MPLRCSLCLKNQLSPPKNPSLAAEYELISISPVLAVHKLCVRTSDGLRDRPDCSDQEIGQEVKRAKDLHCCFCKRKGAAVGCKEDHCQTTYHFLCFLSSSRALKLGKRTWDHRTYCGEHLERLRDSQVRKCRTKQLVKKSVKITLKCQLKTRQRTRYQVVSRVDGDQANCMGKAPAAAKPGQKHLKGIRPRLKVRANAKLSLALPKTHKALTKLCAAEHCLCPFGNNFYDTKSWPLTFCSGCSKSSHKICVRKCKKKWVCKECLKVRTDMKPKKLPVQSSMGSSKSKMAPAGVAKRGRPPKVLKNVEALKDTSQASPTKATAAKPLGSVSPISSMKMSFCKQIDPHLQKIAKLSKKRPERSPLGLKQKEDGKQVEPITVVKLSGKENKEKSPKKQRDTWIVREDLVKKPVGLGKSKKLLAKKKMHKTKKKQQKILVKKDLAKKALLTKKKPEASKSKNSSLASKATKIANGHSSSSQVPSAKTPTSPGSPAKKFVDNSPVEARNSQITSSLKRNLSKVFEEQEAKKKKKSCDKKAMPPPKVPADLKKATKKLVKKISVEPKQLQDRQLFHVLNSLPVEKEVLELEEDYQWLVDNSNRQIDDFLDLNGGEKAFFKLWNTHLHHNPAYGSKMMIRGLETFIDQFGEDIVGGGLYKNFILHLSNLNEFDILDQSTMLQMVARLSRVVAGEKVCDDDDDEKPDTAMLEEEEDSYSMISRVKSRKSSRDSSPEKEEGSSVSSEPSMTLYLSESDDEEEEKKKKEEEEEKCFTMTLRKERSTRDCSHSPLRPRKRKSPASSPQEELQYPPMKKKLFSPKTMPSPKVNGRASPPKLNGVACTYPKMNGKPSPSSSRETTPQKTPSSSPAKSPTRRHLRRSKSVSYASDISTACISDLPVIESGLCSTGTRFKAFANVVKYESEKARRIVSRQRSLLQSSSSPRLKRSAVGVSAAEENDSRRTSAASKVLRKGEENKRNRSM